MCGRFVITSAPAAIRQAFGYIDQPNFPPRYNVAPTQPIPVVLLENGVRRFRLMRWGLIPAWVKDPRKISLMINARAETVRDKAAFKNAMKRRRCLIPADGYYEWTESGGRKRPFYIRPRAGGPIGFAALAETWTGPNGEEVDTVVIVTTAASRDLDILHHRVPVTLAPADFDRWLDGAGTDVETATALLTPPEEGEFVWHEISSAVNRVANDDAQLILPIAAEQATEEAAPKPAKKTAPRGPVAAATNDDQGSLF